MPELGRQDYKRTMSENQVTDPGALGLDQQTSRDGALKANRGFKSLMDPAGQEQEGFI